MTEIPPTSDQPRLYGDLASWWPLLSPPAEYLEEAELFQRLLETASDSAPRTVLELGSGGGSIASHLKRHFELTLVDRSPQMLALSEVLNPECTHLAGDMRTVRFNRTFDAVFVHDAICYMTTDRDLQAAMTTAFMHCRPGGVAIIAPDVVRETFEPGTDEGGSEGPDRSLRYLEWTWDPDPTDTTYLTDYAYLLRHADGSVSAEHDRHVEGLFDRATWLRLQAEVGFTAEHRPLESHERGGEVFLGRRPST